MKVDCSYCHRDAELVTGAQLYPHLEHLARKKYWQCKPCGAHVGCHPKNTKQGRTGEEPLGRLANAQLRRAKQAAHVAFDALWKGGSMTRPEAYQWLSEVMALPVNKTHIGEFDEAQCAAVVAHVNNRKADQ